MKKEDMYSYDKRRKSKRYKLKNMIEIQFKLPRSEIVFSGMLYDISRGGLSILSAIFLKDIFAVGTELILSLDESVYNVRIQHIHSNICGCEFLTKKYNIK